MKLSWLVMPLLSLSFLVSCNPSNKLTSLCFTANEDNSRVSYLVNGEIDIDIEVSFNEQKWSNWDGRDIILVKDERMYVRNITNTLSKSDNDYFKFVTKTGSFTMSGNVMSMVNYSALSENCFNGLFDSCNITTAPSLPATTLANCCYEKMFMNCSYLTTPPNLGSPTLKRLCYYQMFYGCEKLKIYQDYSGFQHRGSKFFVCPSPLGLDISIIDMFKGTTGEFRDTPTEGHTYYWYLE